MNRRYCSIIFIAALLLLALCSCGKDSARSIAFDGDTIHISGNGCTQKDGIVTITEPGSYELSGTLTDGQLVVNVPDTKAVYLTLNGVNISCSFDSPILVEAAPLVVIRLAEGTTNVITDNHTYDALGDSAVGGEDQDLFTEAPDSAIYSRAPLLLEGEGALTVGGKCYNGICSNDTLTIRSGDITVAAAHHGIKGRDYIVVSGGKLNITSGNDGLSSTNLDSAHMGYIHITGGDIRIQAGDEGLYAPHDIKMEGGTVSLNSTNAGLKSEGTISLLGGTMEIYAGDEALLCSKKVIGEAATVTAGGRPLR